MPCFHFKENPTVTPQPSSPRTIAVLRAWSGSQSEIGRARRARESRLLSCSFLALVLLLAFSSLLTEKASGQTPSAANAQMPRPSHQNPNGMRIYIWAGLKSHLPGQHDYPQFLADWSKILTEHGAVVDGALHGPSAADLEHVDVVIIYRGDAGYLSDEEKAALEAYIKRGGGLVSIHDSLCGPDPAYFATLVGGAKKHGEINYTLDAPIPYTVVDSANPIMKGMSKITIFDEAFYNMTWAQNPSVHVLATTVIPGTPSAGTHKGEVVPQIWTYEHTLSGGQTARAFVWMQGHVYANFDNYQIRQMLLRGIAWAGREPVDSLVDYVPPSLEKK
jgi:type 1 glutamine amidotransferase